MGVPDREAFLRVCIFRPTLNDAVPELFPVQGRNMLKSSLDRYQMGHIGAPAAIMD